MTEQEAAATAADPQAATTQQEDKPAAPATDDKPAESAAPATDDKPAEPAAPATDDKPAEPAAQVETEVTAEPKPEEPKAAAAKPRPAPRVRRSKKAVAKIEIFIKPDHIKANQRHAKDVGSTEVQVSLLTGRILHLTEHMKVHPKDKHSNYGLRNMVSQRKRLLRYLEKTKPDSFKELKTALNLR